ncbi:unnamed protein product [Gongylonema pulchrum]|uniref:HORMA domain-containing protein n=1 Tax=Gongylonema pulchrum TaxID=637853 RepID=A0A183DSY0_9BILA|nr:unnamed protein product [Gongylonema pulchrum]
MERMQLFLVSMDDEESRTLFMQRMLALIVLKVMSKRRILPPSAFRDTVIDGWPSFRVECPMLSYKVDVCEALDFSITGANHALAKHYLRDLRILMSEAEEADEVIEMYEITFTYADGGRLGVRSLLDITLESLLPLPEEVRPYFRLTFYEDTPAQYYPMGYNSVTAPYHFKQADFPQKSSSLIFNTNFLSCSVRITSLFFSDAAEERGQDGSVEEVERTVEQPGELQLKERAADEVPETPRPKRKRRCAFTHALFEIVFNNDLTVRNLLCLH